MPPDPDLSATARRPSASLDELARRLGTAGFVRWWAAELAPLVPVGTRTAVQRRRMRPVLAFEGETAALWQPVVRDGRLAMVEGTTIALAGEPAAVAAAGRAALDAAVRAAHGPGAAPMRVAVALPSRHVLRKALVLPAAVEENLRQAIAYDLDRHTPFKADELYFDAVVVERDAARGELRVDLAAARRNVVDVALRHAESFGAMVVAVVPDPPGVVGGSRLNLLPPERRPSLAPWRRWQFWAPMALLALVTLAAVVLPLWQKREYAIALGNATDEALKQAAVSDGLRTELERLAGDYNFVLERKYLFPSDLEVLNEVTKLLPDDTWLLQFEVKSVPRAKEPQRELLLRGESANAGRLISALEESKFFTQAAPRSPTTKIQPGPGEIFDLAAQVRPVTLPAPQSLAATSAEASTHLQAAPSTSAAAPPSAPPVAGPAATPPGAAPAAQAPAAASVPSAAPPRSPAVPLTPDMPASVPGAPRASATGVPARAGSAAASGTAAPPPAAPPPPIPAFGPAPVFPQGSPPAAGSAGPVAPGIAAPAPTPPAVPDAAPPVAPPDATPAEGAPGIRRDEGVR